MKLHGFKFYIRQDQDEWLNECFGRRERSNAVQLALDLFWMEKDADAERKRAAVEAPKIEAVL